MPTEQNSTAPTNKRQVAVYPIEEVMQGIANAQADEHGVNRPFPNCTLVGYALGLSAYNDAKSLVLDRRA